MKKKVLLISLLGACTIGATSVTLLSMNSFIRAEGEAGNAVYTKTLGSSESPTTSTSYVNVTNHPLAGSTFYYYSVKNNPSGFCKLAKGGRITKDEAKGLTRIKAEFSGGLIVRSGFAPNDMFTEATLTNNQYVGVCGDYFEIVATAETSITTLTYEFKCTANGEQHVYKFDGTEYVCDRCGEKRSTTANSTYYHLYNMQSKIQTNNCYWNAGSHGLEFKKDSGSKYVAGNGATISFDANASNNASLVLGISNLKDRKVTSEWFKFTLNGMEIHCDQNTIPYDEDYDNYFAWLDLTFSNVNLVQGANEFSVSIRKSEADDGTNQTPYTISYLDVGEPKGVTFEAEDAYRYSASSNQDEFIACEFPIKATGAKSASGKRSLALGRSTKDDYILFNVYATQACNAKLSTYVNGTNFDFETIYHLFVNNASVTVGHVSKASTVAYFSFDTPVDVNISLNAGWNEIKYVVDHNADGTGNGNFDRIVITPPEGVKVFGNVHNLEAENGELSSGLQIESNDDLKKIASNNKSVGSFEPNRKITLNYYSPCACEAYIAVDGNQPDRYNYDNNVTLTINGTAVSLYSNTKHYWNSTADAYYSFSAPIYAKNRISLKEGNNVIVYAAKSTAETANGKLNTDRIMIFPASL